MTTFKDGSEKEPLVETRPRSYSQENIRDDDEMLETKTMSYRGAMSQYVCHQ